MTGRAKVWWTMWASVMFVAVGIVAISSAKAAATGGQAVLIAAATAPATQVAPITGADDAHGIAAGILAAVRGSNWRLAVVFALAGLVLLARKFSGALASWLPYSLSSGWFGKLLRWFQTDRGGAWLVLISGVLTVAINGLVAGKGCDPQLLIDGFSTAITAAGGYAVLKKLFLPSDKPAPPAPGQ